MTTEEAIWEVKATIVCVSREIWHKKNIKGYPLEHLIKTRQVLLESLEALEKQIPCKPKEYEDKYFACKCGNVLMNKWKKYPTVLMPKSDGLPYCLNCGQKIDWN